MRPTDNRTRSGNGRSARPLFLFSLGLALWIGACADGDTNGTRLRSAPIAEGTRSESDSAVFLIEVGERGLCTGVLLTPRLLLTAGHCVSGQFVAVECGAVPLAPALPASTFRVTNWPDLQSSPPGRVFSSVASAEVIFEGDDLCGNDLGLLELTDPIEDGTLLALSTSRPEEADAFRMIGYGAGHASGTGERIRRTSGPLEVSCASAETCSAMPWEGAAGAALFEPPSLAANEWLGPQGACPGDSGGPAVAVVDDEERVTGILSRGTDDCALSIFSLPNRSALRATVRRISTENGDPVPDWAQRDEHPTDDPPPARTLGGGAGGEGGGGAGGSVDEPPLEDPSPTFVEGSGCTCRAAAPETRGETALFVLVVLAGSAHLRRRRTPSC